MTLPCVHRTVLVLPALLGVWLCPSQAEKLQGGCDSEGGCEVVDDTGLMQAPLRKSTEVKKVPGVVGKQDGAAAISSNAVAPQLLATATASAGDKTAETPVIASTGAMQEVKAATTQQQAEVQQEAGQAPLSFFQVEEEKGSESNAQDDALNDDVNTLQDDLDIANLLKETEDTPVSSEGSETPVAASASILADAPDDGPQDSEVQDEDEPGWVWAALETAEASLRSTFGQVLMLLAAVALVVHSMLQWHASGLRPRDALSAKMRKKLESMPLATGVEVRNLCALDGGSAEKETSAGVLMRIQGRVMSKAVAPLVAPLSGRSCVLYSASVAQDRRDGVHQPPVAFASAARDFTVQLEDCPEMMLEVSSQDVFPFDMESGRYACEMAFGDAPDSWRGFMLDNLTPCANGGGAKGQQMNRVDLGAKGPLNFRECALVVGSRVTCIGEVVREHNGKLRLSPWSPPPPEHIGEQTPLSKSIVKSTKTKAKAWLTPEAEPWLHQLMISDDSRLLVEASQLPLPGKCRSCTPGA